MFGNCRGIPGAKCDVVRDPEHGWLVCRVCGAADEKSAIDFGAEWRDYSMLGVGTDSDGPRRARASFARNDFMFEDGYSGGMGRSGSGGIKHIMVTDREGHEHPLDCTKEENERLQTGTSKVFRMLNEMGAQVGAERSVIDMAQAVYLEYRKHFLFKEETARKVNDMIVKASGVEDAKRRPFRLNKSKEIVMVCLFIGFRLCNEPKTFSQMLLNLSACRNSRKAKKRRSVEVEGMTVASLTAEFNRMRGHLPPSFLPDDILEVPVDDLVERICTALDLPFDFQRFAKKLLPLIKPELEGKTPTSVAVMAVYLTEKHMFSPSTFKEEDDIFDAVLKEGNVEVAKVGLHHAEDYAKAAKMSVGGVRALFRELTERQDLMAAPMNVEWD